MVSSFEEAIDEHIERTAVCVVEIDSSNTPESGHQLTFKLSNECGCYVRFNQGEPVNEIASRLEYIAKTMRKLANAK